jgi:hypothetical protein
MIQLKFMGVCLSTLAAAYNANSLPVSRSLSLSSYYALYIGAKVGMFEV